MLELRVLRCAVVAALLVRSGGQFTEGVASTTNVPGDTDAAECATLFAQANARLPGCILGAGNNIPARCQCVYDFDASTAACKHELQTSSQDIDLDADSSFYAQCPGLQAQVQQVQAQQAQVQTPASPVTFPPVAATANVGVGASAQPAGPTPAPAGWEWWQYLLVVLLLLLLIGLCVGAYVAFAYSERSPARPQYKTASREQKLTASEELKPPPVAEYEPLQNDGIPFPVPEGVSRGAYAPTMQNVPPTVTNLQPTVPSLGYGMPPGGPGGLPGTMAAFPQTSMAAGPYASYAPVPYASYSPGRGY